MTSLSIDFRGISFCKGFFCAIPFARSSAAISLAESRKIESSALLYVPFYSIGGWCLCDLVGEILSCLFTEKDSGLVVDPFGSFSVSFSQFPGLFRGRSFPSLPRCLTSIFPCLTTQNNLFFLPCLLVPSPFCLMALEEEPAWDIVRSLDGSLGL